MASSPSSHRVRCQTVNQCKMNQVTMHLVQGPALFNSSISICWLYLLGKFLALCSTTEAHYRKDWECSECLGIARKMLEKCLGLSHHSGCTLGKHQKQQQCQEQKYRRLRWHAGSVGRVGPGKAQETIKQKPNATASRRQLLNVSNKSNEIYMPLYIRIYRIV